MEFLSSISYPKYRAISVSWSKYFLRETKVFDQIIYSRNGQHPVLEEQTFIFLFAICTTVCFIDLGKLIGETDCRICPASLIIAQCGLPTQK